MKKTNLIIYLLSSLLTMSLFASHAFANTFEEADKLYNQRGEEPERALLAANIYRELSDAAQDNKEKALLKIKESQAIYYYCDQLESDKDKISFHERGFTASNKAIQLLTGGDEFSTVPLDENYREDLARAHYFSASHIGKWASAQNDFVSLRNWAKKLNVKGHVEAIIAIDPKVEQYGGHRILGVANLLLPPISGGDIADSYKYLTEAYEKTFNEEFSMSSNVYTALYYLDTLASINDEDNLDKFCTIYDSLSELVEASDEDLEKLNPGMFPETKSSLKLFESGDIEGFKEDFHDYADTNC